MVHRSIVFSKLIFDITFSRRSAKLTNQITPCMLSFKTSTHVKKQKRNSEFFSFLLLTDVFKAEAGRKIKILFSTKDAKGNLFYEADNQVGVKIQASSGNFVKEKIEDNLNGNYTVSFTPDIVGPHSVTITVNGQPLTGSPWSVEVSPYQYKRAFDITVDNGPFSSAIAVNKETNEIAVIRNNLMIILSADHSFVRNILLKEIILSMDFTINGSFVAVLLSNLNRKLYLIDDSGKSIKEIGQGYLLGPTAVSVSHDGSIIVCDSSVNVFSPDGTKLLRSFSDSHFLLNSPRFSIYHQDMFFVSYGYWDACVRTFSKYGVFLYDIGGEGSAEGRLTSPGGLAIDKFDNLIVSEDKTLKVFTVEGNFLYKIVVEHEEKAFAASNTGNLYVVNEDCIQVFQ